MIAETLLREAFHALDQSPGDPRVLALLRRVNAGSYDRLTGNVPDDYEAGVEGQNQVPNSADLKLQLDRGEGPVFGLSDG